MLTDCIDSIDSASAALGWIREQHSVLWSWRWGLWSVMYQ